LKEKDPVILVYRRTHTGDPCKDGRFGCNDCMKSVRDWDYDAVIGIGGAKPEFKYKGIKERITWIGITPKKEDATADDRERMKREYGIYSDFGGKIVTFDRFLLLDEDGPLVIDVAENLHKYMFIDHKIPRAAKYFENKSIYDELLTILKLADGSPPSQARFNTSKLEYEISKCASSYAPTKRKGCA